LGLLIQHHHRADLDRLQVLALGGLAGFCECTSADFPLQDIVLAPKFRKNVFCPSLSNFRDDLRAAGSIEFVEQPPPVSAYRVPTDVEHLTDLAICMTSTSKF
jgi:hypothetical protein